MIWAALSGVPCLRSCPLMPSTLSLFLSLPSLAASPPGSRSRMKTPGSSDLRMSLMPSGSERSRFTRVTWMMVLWFWLGLGDCDGGEAEGWARCSGRGLKPFSCMTVSLTREHDCRSTAMARLWGMDAKLTSLTCKDHTVSLMSQCNESSHRSFLPYFVVQPSKTDYQIQKK